MNFRYQKRHQFNGDPHLEMLWDLYKRAQSPGAKQRIFGQIQAHLIITSVSSYRNKGGQIKGEPNHAN